MLFNSFAFAIYFPIVTALYFLLPHRFRWALLLTASCIFYAFFIPKYLVILFLLIGIDYTAGLWIENAQGRKRKSILVLSLVANCGILFVFKYFNFFAENISTIAQLLHWNYSLETLKIVLPIGLSFHTFQSMSYTIEVYLGRQKVEKNLGIYALYVMFYPQLVAGPIERPQNLLHQFREKHSFEYQRVKSGLLLMAGGLFKKIAIADNLAIFVNEVYAAPEKYQGIPLWIATYFFAFQIFCDFSGYTDIARGAARVMGFSLMENFNRPYFSKSISEFWHRWHISLSSWFRDYLYIPMGGSKVSNTRWAFNIMIVFLVSGFWHGANWTFIAWGFLHGLFIIMEKYLSPLKRIFTMNEYPRFEKVIAVGITFHLACFAWIYFRAESIQDAFHISRYLFTSVFSAENMHFLHEKSQQIAIGILLISSLLVVHLIHRRQIIWNIFEKKPKYYRWAAYYVFLLSLVILSMVNGQSASQKFIYFQF